MKFILAFMLLAFPVLQAAVAAEEKADATAIVTRVEKNLGPPNYQAFFAFTNYRTDGTVMNYEVRFETRDADHSHGIFLKPEREKGRELLRLADDLWTFVPSVGRVIRIADRDSFAGGDFSNADVLRIDWLKKYDPKIIKDLPKQWIIELIAKSSEAPYASMRLWVDKSSSQPVQQHYYDSKGTLLKRCLYGEVKSYGNISRPSRLVMENVITKQKSELKVLALSTSASIPDSRFVVDNLGK